MFFDGNFLDSTNVIEELLILITFSLLLSRLFLNSHTDYLPLEKKNAQLPAVDMQKVPGSFFCYSNHSPKVIRTSFDKTLTCANLWSLDGSLAGACCMSTADTLGPKINLCPWFGTNRRLVQLECIGVSYFPLQINACMHGCNAATYSLWACVCHNIPIFFIAIKTQELLIPVECPYYGQPSRARLQPDNQEVRYLMPQRLISILRTSAECFPDHQRGTHNCREEVYYRVEARYCKAPQFFQLDMAYTNDQDIGGSGRPIRWTEHTIICLSVRNNLSDPLMEAPVSRAIASTAMVTDDLFNFKENSAFNIRKYIFSGDVTDAHPHITALSLLIIMGIGVLYRPGPARGMMMVKLILKHPRNSQFNFNLQGLPSFSINVNIPILRSFNLELPELDHHGSSTEAAAAPPPKYSTTLMALYKISVLILRCRTSDEKSRVSNNVSPLLPPICCCPSHMTMRQQESPLEQPSWLALSCLAIGSSGRRICKKKDELCGINPRNLTDKLLSFLLRVRFLREIVVLSFHEVQESRCTPSPELSAHDFIYIKTLAWKISNREPICFLGLIFSPKNKLFSVGEHTQRQIAPKQRYKLNCPECAVVISEYFFLENHQGHSPPGGRIKQDFLSQLVARKDLDTKLIYSKFRDINFTFDVKFRRCLRLFNTHQSQRVSTNIFFQRRGGETRSDLLHCAYSISMCRLMMLIYFPFFLICPGLD
ncbi:hypothetical protein VP01_1084g1 [Puccinia sorghi]|uniref:Uncharacterized protein n=1 Tax=Puccinia sorghi TaxID=27349 RepID=A0A0L6VT96_9BASI|nr:hypothetical protein VP01_1084g1 [Puccinia sorghi]